MSTKDTKIINETESHLKVTRAHRRSRNGTTRHVISAPPSTMVVTAPQSEASGKTAVSVGSRGKLLDGSVGEPELAHPTVVHRRLRRPVQDSDLDPSSDDQRVIPYMSDFHTTGSVPDGSLIFSSSSSDTTGTLVKCPPPKNFIEFLRMQLRAIWNLLPDRWVIYTQVRNNVLFGFVISGLLYYPLAVVSSSLSAVNRTLFGSLKRMLLTLPVLELVKAFKERAGLADKLQHSSLLTGTVPGVKVKDEKARMKRRRLGHLMMQAERLRARKNALKRALMEEEGRFVSRRHAAAAKTGLTPSEYDDVFSESEREVSYQPNRERVSRLLGGIDKELRQLKMEIEEAHGSTGHAGVAY